MPFKLDPIRTSVLTPKEFMIWADGKATNRKISEKEFDAQSATSGAIS